MSPAFPKGDGTNLTCPCSAPGAQCFNNMMVLPNGSMTAGTCWCRTPPASACGTVVDHCTGNTIQCRCAANQFCSGTTCSADLTCNDYGANGVGGAVCSNGASFPTGALPDGGAATDSGGCCSPASAMEAKSASTARRW